MEDLETTRDLLDRQLTAAVVEDPLGALPGIVALQRVTDQHLREAVKQATVKSSWSAIATELGVSKQAAHQRFKAYAKEVAVELKSEHRAMKSARRAGDTEQAVKAKARRDELAANLRTAAKALKDGQ